MNQEAEGVQKHELLDRRPRGLNSKSLITGIREETTNTIQAKDRKDIYYDTPRAPYQRPEPEHFGCTLNVTTKTKRRETACERVIGGSGTRWEAVCIWYVVMSDDGVREVG